MRHCLAFALTLSLVGVGHGQPGKQPDPKAIRGGTPTEKALSAAKVGNLKVLQSMLKKGVNVGARDKNRNTLLHYAAGNGHQDIVKYLVARDADFNAVNHAGYSVLHWATVHGDLEVVKYLVGRGANVQGKTDNGVTVLMQAINPTHLEVAKYLVEKGGDIQAKTKKAGWTALLMSALATKHERGTKRKFDYHIVVAPDWTLAKYLVAKGADVNVKIRGKALLHWVAEAGQWERVKYLVENKADVNVTDADGKTVLDYAQRSENTQMITYLKSKGGKSVRPLK